MSQRRTHLRKRTVALLFAGLWQATAALALDPDKHIDQYAHETWTAQDGLPGEAVYQILQSPDGYLWLRTSAGLVRFDGERFVLVDPVVGKEALNEPVILLNSPARSQVQILTTL